MSIPDDYKLSANFEAWEARCRDGTDLPAEYLGNAEEVAREVLERIRRRIGVAMDVVSWYRTPAWNKRKGGKPKSGHLTAKAVDFRGRGRTPRWVHDQILDMYQIGELPVLGGLGLYGHPEDEFVHVDTMKAPDGHLRRWVGRGVGSEP